MNTQVEKVNENTAASTQKVPCSLRNCTGVKKRFRRIDVRGLITFKCPHCNGAFGLEPNLFMSMGECNFHFTCPYCGKDGGIEND